MTDNSKEIAENLQRAETSINAAKDMIEKILRYCGVTGLLCRLLRGKRVVTERKY